jgi:hypothetical protein
MLLNSAEFSPTAIAGATKANQSQQHLKFDDQPPKPEHNGKEGEIFGEPKRRQRFGDTKRFSEAGININPAKPQ